MKSLLTPPPGMAVDFSQPRGARALAPENGISWQIFANPVSLFIGGVSAVLLELAEPSVRSGVWDHSSFRREPLQRLQRTGYAAMVTVYAPAAVAEQMIARVVQRHSLVRGHTADGLTYDANDPRLLDWVQATAVFGFSEAFHRYVAPLSPMQRSLAFAEGAPAARLYGAHKAPQDWAGWEGLLARTAPGLEDSPILGEFLDLMESVPTVPRPLRALQRLLVRAAVDMTPEPVRSLPQLQHRGLRRGEAVLVHAMARAARLLPLTNWAPMQAHRRMNAACTE